ncbi:MAG: archaellin/type IV pilin N-terminal domain-containing protein [Candidatus Woesearchaeota archaeon]
MMNKKADMGIGTLIIFIAMILVAAIAAGVLIQTATSLQNRALLTGDRTRGQVSTGMNTLLLYAMNGTNGTVDDFRQKVQLSPGSDPVTLETALLSFDTDRISGDYTFTNDTCEYDDTGGTGTGYHFNETEGNGTFAVRYLVEGPNHQDGYLVRGDIVELCYAAPEQIEEDTRLRLSFNPQRGTPLTIDTSTPNIMTSERVYIFP